MSWGRYRLFTEKKGKTVAPSRTLQAKGEMYPSHGKALLLNAINIYYVIARELNLSPVVVLHKAVFSLFVLLKRNNVKLTL